MEDLEVSHQGSKDKVDILYLFKDSIKADGSVDMRSTLGRSLRTIKEAIKDDKFRAAESILINDIAMLATLEKAIECHVLSNPETIFSDSGLNPLLASNLLRFREIKYRAINLLLGLKPKKGKKNRDLNEILLD